MSQNCYNLLTFWGNTKVNAQVAQWKSRIDEDTDSGKTSNDSNTILSILLAESSNGRETEIGVGLVGFESEIINAGNNQIGILSSGQRPELLEDALACFLYKLDKKVVVRNSFHNLDGLYGVAYTAPYDSTSAYSQFTSIVCDYDDFEFPEDAELDAEEKLEEAENEIIEFFVDDMPETKSKFKKNIAKGRIDWDSI
jgi:hypothetical protein